MSSARNEEPMWGTEPWLPEREALGLTGLLPTGVSTLEGQLRRVYAQYLEQANDLRKWVNLANLRDRNEVLFYRLLTEHISEMLPVVYTPTVGLAIERFSQEFRRTRGVYLSVEHPEDVETALRNTGLGPNDVDLLAATDSEGILGIGDQDGGGIEISIGKLAVYTAAAGIHPRRVLPVVLDMGTDNLKLLNDDMYLGARHARIRDRWYGDRVRQPPRRRLRPQGLRLPETPHLPVHRPRRRTKPAGPHHLPARRRHRLTRRKRQAGGAGVRSPRRPAHGHDPQRGERVAPARRGSGSVPLAVLMRKERRRCEQVLSDRRRRTDAAHADGSDCGAWDISTGHE